MNVNFYKKKNLSAGIMEAGWVPPNERAGGRSTTRTPDDPDMLYHAFKTILNATKNHQVSIHLINILLKWRNLEQCDHSILLH